MSGPQPMATWQCNVLGDSAVDLGLIRFLIGHCGEDGLSRICSGEYLARLSLTVDLTADQKSLGKAFTFFRKCYVPFFGGYQFAHVEPYLFMRDFYNLNKRFSVTRESN